MVRTRNEADSFELARFLVLRAWQTEHRNTIQLGDARRSPRHLQVVGLPKEKSAS